VEVEEPVVGLVALVPQVLVLQVFKAVMVKVLVEEQAHQELVGQEEHLMALRPLQVVLEG
jgi:hypothetical protein